MRCFFSQVHQCCRLPGFDHEAGHSGRKCLYRLPHLWLGGVSCRLPHPVHHWAHRPTPPLRHGQFCSWSLLFHHCLYSWQWVILFGALERWFPSFLLMVLSVLAGMFWFKTAVACIGRLGITMTFEMVVFVNTELYPTFVRYNTENVLCLGWTGIIYTSTKVISKQQ